MGKTFTGTDLIDVLWEMVRKSSQKDVAGQLGMSTAFINDVLRGRREMTVRLAEAMGYEQVVIYRKVA